MYQVIILLDGVFPLKSPIAPISSLTGHFPIVICPSRPLNVGSVRLCVMGFKSTVPLRKSLDNYARSAQLDSGGCPFSALCPSCTPTPSACDIVAPGAAVAISQNVSMVQVDSGN